MRPSLRHAVFAFAFVPLLAIAEQRPRMPVSVQVKPEDGMTLTFAEEIRDAIKRSKDFDLADVEHPFTITIPASLRTKGSGRQNKVFYLVLFTSAEKKPLGMSEGQCWDYELSQCAQKILSDARKAAR